MPLAKDNMAKSVRKSALSKCLQFPFRYRIMVLVLLLLALSSVLLTQGDFRNVDEGTNYRFEEVVSTWHQFDKNIKQFAGASIKQALPYIMDVQENVNISSECSRNIFHIALGLKNLKLWALTFFDASAKLRAGTIGLIPAFLGRYDQCLDAKGLNRRNEVLFKGNYCKLVVRLPLVKPRPANSEAMLKAMKNATDMTQLLANLSSYFYDYPFKIGLCLPTGCSLEDVNAIFKYVGNKLNMEAEVSKCEEKKDTVYKITLARLISIMVLSLMILCVAIGSSLDFYASAKDATLRGKYSRLLRCFSFQSSVKKLFSTELPEDSIDCLHGVRALTLLWIIWCHENFLFLYFNPLVDTMEYHNDLITTFIMQIAINIHVPVDAFFFIGGFLQVHRRMKSANNKQGILYMIAKRLWRIYPGLISVMMFSLLLHGYGPLNSDSFHHVATENCEQRWWANILFIQNHWRIEDICLGQTWYLAAEFQLFLTSLVLIPILLRKTKLGVTLIILCILVSASFTFAWSWIQHSPPVYLYSSPNQKLRDLASTIYLSTYKHLPQYFLGILFGYIVTKKKDLHIPKVAQILCWISSAAVFVTVVFVSQRWNSGKSYTQIETALYHSTAKIAYILGLAWLILCCTTGHGGIINDILKVKLFVHLSKLSYLMYLISVIIQMYFVGAKTSKINTDWLSTVWRYFGSVCITWIISVIFNLLFETPFEELRKLVFNSRPSESVKAEGNTVEISVKNHEVNDKNSTLQDNLKEIQIKETITSCKDQESFTIKL